MNAQHRFTELGLIDRLSIPTLEEERPPEQPGARRTFIAGVLSALLPGLGQLYKRDWLKAGLFFFLLGVLMGFIAVLRLPTSWNGHRLMVAAAIALACAAVADALFSAGRESPAKPPSQWWTLAFMLPAAFLIWTLAGRWMHAVGIRAFHIPTRSMHPTVQADDRVVADNWYYRRHAIIRGDVVTLKHDNVIVITRVIALPGDIVEGTDAGIMVNSKVLPEPYAVLISGDSPAPGGAFGPITVPVGQLFVMGDNRAIAYDSRHPNYGPVYMGDVHGRAMYIMSLDEERNGTEIE